MAIKLPGLCIREPLELLRWKLGLPPDGKPLDKPLFVPYEAFDGLVDSAPDEIRLEDLYATTAMNSEAGAGAALSLARLLRNEPKRDELNRAIGTIRCDWTVEEPLAQAQAKTILRTLLDPEVESVGVSVTFKLLCRKRSRLFPMWDSRVEGYALAASQEKGPKLDAVRLQKLPMDKRVDRALIAMKWLQDRVKDNRGELEQVVDDLNRDIKTGWPDCPRITELRALETLIWLAMSPRWWGAGLWPATFWSECVNSSDGPGITFERFGPRWLDYCISNNLLSGLCAVWYAREREVRLAWAEAGAGEWCYSVRSCTGKRYRKDRAREPISTSDRWLKLPDLTETSCFHVSATTGNGTKEKEIGKAAVVLPGKA